MKKYVGIESARPIRGKYSFKVYRVKYNSLHYVGTGDFTYASTRGPSSEVMHTLAEIGEIPKKYKNKYYSGERPSNIEIKYICPLNQK